MSELLSTMEWGKAIMAIYAALGKLIGLEVVERQNEHWPNITDRFARILSAPGAILNITRGQSGTTPRGMFRASIYNELAHEFQRLDVDGGSGNFTLKQTAEQAATAIHRRLLSAAQAEAYIAALRGKYDKKQQLIDAAHLALRTLNTETAREFKALTGTDFPGDPFEARSHTYGLGDAVKLGDRLDWFEITFNGRGHMPYRDLCIIGTAPDMPVSVNLGGGNFTNLSIPTAAKISALLAMDRGSKL